MVPQEICGPTRKKFCGKLVLDTTSFLSLSITMPNTWVFDTRMVRLEPTLSDGVVSIMFTDYTWEATVSAKVLSIGAIEYGMFKKGEATVTFNEGTVLVKFVTGEMTFMGTLNVPAESLKIENGLSVIQHRDSKSEIHGTFGPDHSSADHLAL